jgi:hypothetical protein
MFLLSSVGMPAAMPALYGPGGPYQTGVGVGTIGTSVTIAINGLGGNNSVLNVLLNSPTPVQSSTWGRVKSLYR